MDRYVFNGLLDPDPGIGTGTSGYSAVLCSTLFLTLARISLTTSTGNKCLRGKFSLLQMFKRNFISIVIRNVDPHSFFVDPDPDVVFNVDPDPAAFIIRIQIRIQE